MIWDSNWDRVFREDEWGKYPDESFIRFVARNYYKEKRSDIEILEVGCGPGANIWYTAREGFNVYGIDGSNTAIQKAMERLKNENLKADLRVGDIIKLPYENKIFDAVADNECLAHNSSKNLDSILAEVKRVLKKGGLFYSRCFTDQVYIGKTRTELNPLEYTDVSDGPFGGRGFVRLTTRDGIERTYGKYFNILSVDKLEYTQNNETTKICEWIIICKNEK